MDWTTLQEAWNNYALIIVLGAVAIIAVGVRLYRNWKDKQDMKKAAALQKKIPDILPPTPPPGVSTRSPQEILPPIPPSRRTGFDLSQYESLLGEADKPSAERENVVEQINALNKKMRKESGELDKQIKEDKAKMEETLKEVLQNKQKLLEYGKQMSELYKTYEERERQLGLTMVALNRVLRSDGEEGGRK